MSRSNVFPCSLFTPFYGSRSNYTGKQWDEDAELYYFNARWYDPETARFITEDPIKDGLLWFAYVNNNPMNYIDPTGLSWEDNVPEDVREDIVSKSGDEDAQRREEEADALQDEVDYWGSGDHGISPKGGRLRKKAEKYRGLDPEKFDNLMNKAKKADKSHQTRQLFGEIRRLSDIILSKNYNSPEAVKELNANLSQLSGMVQGALAEVTIWEALSMAMIQDAVWMTNMSDKALEKNYTGVYSEGLLGTGYCILAWSVEQGVAAQFKDGQIVDVQAYVTQSIGVATNAGGEFGRISSTMKNGTMNDFFGLSSSGGISGSISGASAGKSMTQPQGYRGRAVKADETVISYGASISPVTVSGMGNRTITFEQSFGEKKNEYAPHGPYPY